MTTLASVRHYIRKRAVGIFLAATVFLSALSYFIFDMYVSSVGQEIVGAWLQSEAIAIQEGNLLTSITKNQRVLLSSRFISGMKLLDHSVSPASELISFGQSFIPKLDQTPTLVGTMIVVRSGFLQKQIFYRVPGRPYLTLVTEVRSDLLSKGFFGVVAVLVGFLLVIITVVRRVEQREAVFREKILKRALTDMVLTNESSQYVQSEFPLLAKWWNEKKIELENGQRIATLNEKNAALGELAARLAHDIRSPLNTLTSVSESVAKMSPEHERLFKMAVQRLREITGDIMQTYKVKSKASEKTPIAISPSAIYLLLLAEEIVEENQAQRRGKNITFNIQKGERSLDAVSRISAGEFKRHLSNVIDNAAEAVMDRENGVVNVAVDADDENSIITITDNGKGLSEILASQVGKKGFTFGKTNGSGFGLHFLKEALSKIGGNFRFESKENEGSRVTVTIPREKSHPAALVTLTNLDSLLILDDDPGIHESWRQKLNAAQIEIPVEHAFDPESASKWLKANSADRKIGVLTDFQLNHRLNGLDFLEQHRELAAMSLLVTSSYNEAEVIATAERLSVPLLPKPLLASIAIRTSVT